MAASEKPEKTAYVYMVRCAGGQLYTGWTNDPEARLKAHQSGKGAKYTRTHTALGFAYLEACADKFCRPPAGDRPEKADKGPERGPLRRVDG